MDEILDTGSFQLVHTSRCTRYDKHGTTVQSLEGRNSVFGIFIIA